MENKQLNMKPVIIALFLFFSNIAFSQENQNILFKNAIASIKQSEEFKSYTKNCSSKNDNIKVSKKIYSICEFSIFFKDITGKETFKNCEESDWINNTFKEIQNAEELSDKGKRNYNIWFSNIVNSFFVAEIKSQNHSNIILANLFKIENGKVSLIKSIQLTKD